MIEPGAIARQGFLENVFSLAVDGWIGFEDESTEGPTFGATFFETFGNTFGDTFTDTFK